METASYEIAVWVCQLEVNIRHSFLGLASSLQTQEFQWKSQAFPDQQCSATHLWKRLKQFQLKSDRLNY